MATLKDEIWQQLGTVKYLGRDRDLASFGLVKNVAECDGIATVSLDMGRVSSGDRQKVVEAVKEALKPLDGLEALSVEMAAPVPLRPRLQRQAPKQVSRPEGVRHVVAVGSGKGGVGKSTVTVNLAVAFARQGLKIGLMDADAYGPNVPRMMGVDRLPRTKDGRIQPALTQGVRVVSIGFMVKQETPLVWRGPMTDKMVRQFLLDVAWEDLDVLLVDLPPSTGDIPISLGKHTLVDGAVVVVTPQNVASDDARKAISMFRRMEMPILGVVENMSYFVCSECNARHHLFGEGGGRRLALEQDVPFLGEIPLEAAVREAGDQGIPAVLRPGSAAGAEFVTLAEELWQRLEPSQDAASSRDI